MLKRHYAMILVVLGVGILSAAVARAQQDAKAKRPVKLTTMDYIEIQQLAARYPFLIDTCTNSGYDYADLYTDDGEFSVSQEWGKEGPRKTKGRDALARAAGGGHGRENRAAGASVAAVRHAGRGGLGVLSPRTQTPQPFSLFMAISEGRLL